MTRNHPLSPERAEAAAIAIAKEVGAVEAVTDPHRGERRWCFSTEQLRLFYIAAAADGGLITLGSFQ